MVSGDGARSAAGAENANAIEASSGKTTGGNSVEGVVGAVAAMKISSHAEDHLRLVLGNGGGSCVVTACPA